MIETLSWLAEQCRNHLLTEKWLLCSDSRSCQNWKDRISLSGTATINLHGKTIQSAVLGLVAESLAAENLTYLNNSCSVALVHDLVMKAQQEEVLQYFSAVQYTESLAKLLSKSFRDLRLAGISVDGIAMSVFYAPSKAADVRQLYDSYCRALSERKLADYASCLQRAGEGLKRGTISLPTDLMILIPTELRLTFAESQFFEQLAKRVLIQRHDARLAAPDEIRSRLGDFCKQSANVVAYLAGHGESNEVRAVVQHILSAQSSSSNCFDNVELLVTDPATYGPLIYETFKAWMAQRDQAESTDDRAATNLPVTFAEGLPTIYSRPGRALRAWLRWSRGECTQAKAVQMFREGVLQRPESATEIGYARLASQLRKLKIGFRAERYLPTINSTMEEAKRLHQDYLKRRDDDEFSEDDFPRDFGLPFLQAINLMLEPVIRYLPAPTDNAVKVLTKAKKFLLHCARSDNKYDRTARNQLLDDIDARLAMAEFAEESPQAIVGWLEELPLESSILASGPKPGCIHVSSLHSGYVAGRSQVYVMGLDARRFPRSAAIDPVLLDDERTQISAELPTSIEVAQRGEQVLMQVLDQALEIKRVQLCFSFATRNLIDGRTQSPSTSLVEIFRVTESLPQAHIDDLLRHIGPPVSFASMNPEYWLSYDESFLAGLIACSDDSYCRDQVEATYQHLHEQRIALEQRAGLTFTNYDGLVPEAGSDLVPTGRAGQVSPTRLEAYGTCPRRFFYKYGLGVYPPDEWSVDQECWLNPLEFGTLVHSLFEKFLQSHTKQKLIPDLERDLPHLLKLLSEELETHRSISPIPNEDAFHRQRDLLEETCEIFLRREQEYCERTGAIPWVLESSIGLGEEPRSPIDCKEPVPLRLRDGKLLQIGGKLDRVDRLSESGSEHYVIWDYKSGSKFGFSQADPFKQGRKLQSFMYVGMLRHRLAAAGHDKESAISFGYFFPSPKAEGERLLWTTADLRQGDDILKQICEAIADGLFPATTDPNDCTYCNYREVCRHPEFVAVESLNKSLEPSNRNLLKAWRGLRQLDDDQEVSR